MAPTSSESVVQQNQWIKRFHSQEECKGLYMTHFRYMLTQIMVCIVIYSITKLCLNQY